ncbi:cupin domain-containing protein [Erwinia psidii]|uniref:Cupin domain-containing protein n=1 Tax=Erwinia psidii TaxID=69224 RepID=A0A3N6RZV3_9GAMM|nr:cupin domain-containing protein [Erwinia psidii]MCX8956078.1 cupin domain-containing protein [Erwinia psidii]MCX8960155.1 cupin domain-containing protein [Erwinia psidii]MCX8963702.1 cupin domain-containing protein [Erwinia psidii]RQM38778.1 cupin domain-containing protein [Erwinia psidii]
MDSTEARCRLITPQPVEEGVQGLIYQQGISRQSAGAQGIHMQLAFIPPHSQGRAHKHEHHETAIYALKGTTRVRFGENLQHDLEVPEGSFLYIPADMPHLPYNASDSQATVVISRTDACDPEGVVMLPMLDRDVLCG